MNTIAHILSAALSIVGSCFPATLADAGGETIADETNSFATWLDNDKDGGFLGQVAGCRGDFVRAQDGGRDGGPRSSLSVSVRIPFADGEIIPDYTPFPIHMVNDVPKKGIGFGDLLGSGVGVGLEWDLSWSTTVIQSHKPKKYQEDIGAYVSLRFDHYQGRSAADDFGDQIKADDWDYGVLLVGYRTACTFPGSDEGGVMAAGRIGLGAVLYPALNATFSMSGGPPQSGQLLAPTIGVALELAVQLGYRTGNLAMTVGFGFQFMQAPGRGRDAGRSVDPVFLCVGALEIGAEYRF